MARIIEDVSSSISRNEHQADAQPQATSLVRCAVSHRIGTVPVGEPSIGKSPSIQLLSLIAFSVIAVSSPHRKEAFVACEQILEEVKKKAQIWKREYYEGVDDAQAEWKANA